MVGDVASLIWTCVLPDLQQCADFFRAPQILSALCWESDRPEVHNRDAVALSARPARLDLVLEAASFGCLACYVEKSSCLPQLNALCLMDAGGAAQCLAVHWPSTA